MINHPAQLSRQTQTSFQPLDIHLICRATQVITGRMNLLGCPQKDDERQRDAPFTNVTSAALVQCIEAAAAINITRQTEACQILFPKADISTHQIGGGTVAVTLPELGFKLNIVVGLGMATPANEDDLQTIERVYSRIGLPTLIGICPYVDQVTLRALSARNYKVLAFVNAYVRSLDDINPNDTLEAELSKAHKESGVMIKHAQPGEHGIFMRCSVEGFRGNGRPEKVLSTLALIAMRREDTLLYLVMAGDEVAGSGAMAVIETPHGKVGYFYLGSTLPNYRNRGLHQALDKERLLDARKRGCVLAIVETRVGNASGRNAERLGFRVAYNKTYFKRDL